MKKQSAVIDRIVDGTTAVLLIGDAEEKFSCSLDLLPLGSKEGSWLVVVLSQGELVEAHLDEEKTENMLQEVQDKRAKLLKRTRRR